MTDESLNNPTESIQRKAFCVSSAVLFIWHMKITCMWQMSDNELLKKTMNLQETNYNFSSSEKITKLLMPTFTTKIP